MSAKVFNFYKNNDNAKIGDYILTEGGELKCKNVMHICCPKWQEG